VLLPGAFYTLGESRRPPVETLRRAGVPMAVATDLNPGSSPMASLLLNMNMACVLFGLTAEETLLGVTCHAARALGLRERKGRLAVGLDADLVLWPIEDPAELSYGFGLVKPAAIWRGGQRVD
jgi:imidazolonepropionase